MNGIASRAVTDLAERAAGTEAGLRREVRASQYFTMAFGAMVGVGWVIVLGEWLALAGPVGAIMAFLAGGAVMTVVGLCYAELVTALPVAGGELVYAYEVFGLRISFGVGWFLALAYVTTTVFEVISVGWVVGILFPALQGPVLYTFLDWPVHLGSLLLGMAGTVGFTWINLKGVGWAATVEDVLTWLLLALAGLFVAAGIFFGDVANLEPAFQRTSGSIWPGIFAVFMTAPFWYGGFPVIPQLMEERAEQASLPAVGKVIVAAIVAAGLFYCLVILSAAMAGPYTELLDAELPAAVAFEAAFESPLMAKVVLAAALFGLLTSWNTFFLSSSRILFAMGRAPMLPAWFGRVDSDSGAPASAILFVGAVGIVGGFLDRSAILPFVNVVGACLALAFLSSCAAVIRLDRKRSDLPRPYRVPGGTATATIGVIGSAAILLLALYQPYSLLESGLPMEWAFFAGWGILGMLLWYFARRTRRAVGEAERRRLILGALGDEAPSFGAGER